MDDIPLEELKELLAALFTEVDLVEMLGVNATDLVERFSDIIEDDLDKFRRIIEEVR